jgi:hypothetical protein
MAEARMAEATGMARGRARRRRGAAAALVLGLAALGGAPGGRPAAGTAEPPAFRGERAYALLTELCALGPRT